MCAHFSLFSAVELCGTVSFAADKLVRFFNITADHTPEICRQHGDVHDRFLYFLQSGQREFLRQKIEDRVVIFGLVPERGQCRRDDRRVVEREPAAVEDAEGRPAEAGLFRRKYGVQFNVGVGQ